MYQVQYRVNDTLFTRIITYATVIFNSEKITIQSI